MSLDGPDYDPEQVAEAVLREVIARHPLRLSADELVLRVAADPDDSAQAETAREAIRELRRATLIRYRDDDRVIEPTQAAICAHRLLAG
ncbi:MAG TPA: hypothetical protein VH703_05880 [Solirubrobacterales bacterium]